MSVRVAGVVISSVFPALCASVAAFGADGHALFDGRCAACHQKGGVGSANLAPPLVDRPLWEKLGANAVTYISGIMIGGFSGRIVTGEQTWAGYVMPPQDDMSNEELAAIGSYVLGKLNGLALQVTVSAVAQARVQPPTHGELRRLRGGNIDPVPGAHDGTKD
jgi:mono/diheme cytochrome c family protein